VLSLYYLTFLIFVAGLSPLQAGLVTGIAKVWDGIIDPPIGVLVDRTRTKFGASRFWMLLAVVPTFVAYFCLWNFFGIQSQAGKAVWFVFASMLWSLAFSMSAIPYEALLPKIVSGYSERTNFSSARMIFSGVACVATTYIYEWLIPVSKERPLSPGFAPNFTTLGLVLGVFFALPILTTVFGVKEPPRLNTPPITLRSIFTDYREVLKSKIYRKYYLISLCGLFVSNSVTTSMVLFAYLVYGNIANFVWAFTLVFVVVNLKGAIEIAFFVPNVVMMKKYNKHRPYLVDLPFIIAAAVMILFLDSSTSPWLYVIATMIIGGGVSCLGFVPMTLLPDLSDVDEMISGMRREGVNAGLITFGKQIVYGITLAITGAILEAFGLSSETSSPATATPSSVWAVKIIYAVIPIVFSTAMIIMSINYGLDKKSHSIVKRLIDEKRSTGTASASDEEKLICEKLSGMSYDELWVSKD
jgi:Na+/melibiose symporter and related transporters